MHSEQDSPAGRGDVLRALDAEVARQVFGWQLCVDASGGDVVYWSVPEGDPCRDAFGTADAPPTYSTDMNAAWLVVERLRSRGWLVTVKDMPDGFPYIVGDIDEGMHLHRRAVCDLQWMPQASTEDVRRFIYRHPHGAGDTPSEAIARAALQAVEAEVTDDEVRAAWKLPPDAPLIPLIGEGRA